MKKSERAKPNTDFDIFIKFVKFNIKSCYKLKFP